MRREWHIPGKAWQYALSIGVAWFVIGFIGFVPFSPKENHHHWTPDATIAISAWLGPYVLAALVFLAMNFRRTWLPHRRWVPVKEDLRHADRNL